MRLTLSIQDVLPATPRARIVRLDLGGRAFAYVAGQAVRIAPHGHPTLRPFSIAAAPGDTQRNGWLELLVGVDGHGDPSAPLTLERGARIDVDGPLGSFVFPPDPQERRFVFIAGGTGIAPLRAMLGHALGLPHREIGVFYSARTPEEFAYEEELAGLARGGDIAFVQKVTRADDARHWTGPRGRIGRADLDGLVHDPATLCFICGPPGLVEGTSTILQGLGVAPTRIRTEEWGG